MRKVFLVGLVAVLALGLLAGCSQPSVGEQTGNGYKDGTYVVIANDIEAMGHGNYPFIKMTIADGKIAEVDYREYIVETGEPKTTENYNYKESPEAAANLEEQLLEKQDPEALDLEATSGATHTKHNFVEYAKYALEKAASGETYNPVYKDGIYEAKAAEASHGWLAQIRIVVEDGLIVGVDYDEIAVEDSEGEKVIFDEEGNPVVGEDGNNKTEAVQIKAGDEKSTENYKYLNSPAAMENFEKQLIITQDPAALDFDATSGATHTKESIVELAKEALKDAK